MKPHFEIKVYITTDSNGEWWENVGKDGSLRRFEPGTSNFNYAKEFPTLEKAKKYAENAKIKRFKIEFLTPPVKPSITWGQEVVFEQK
jgi:hypothetical protein